MAAHTSPPAHHQHGEIVNIVLQVHQLDTCEVHLLNELDDAVYHRLISVIYAGGRKLLQCSQCVDHMRTMELQRGIRGVRGLGATFELLRWTCC